MVQNRDDLRINFRIYNPSGQIDPKDTEIAFQLQNSQPAEPDVLEQLVYSYAATLYEWVGVLLYYQKQVAPSHEKILTHLRQILVYSITHVDQFHGRVSASAWLFDLCYQMIGSNRYTTRLIDAFRRLIGIENGDASGESVSDYWNSFDGLPEKTRLPLILRYLFDLSLPDIAEILHIKVNEVHSRLIAGRKQLWVNADEPHSDYQIQAYVDGLLDEDPDEVSQLLNHLEECDLCHASAIKLNKLERNLAARTKERWTYPRLSEDELKAFIESILLVIRRPKAGSKVDIPTRQSMWILGLSALSIGLAILFIRITPQERELPQVQPTATQQLPPIIEMQPESVLAPDRGVIPDPPETILPAFSSDGKWAVFATIQRDLITFRSLSATYQLYNRETNSIRTISENSPSISSSWADWVLLPSISADGQWIAFAGIISDSEIAGDPCESNYAGCLDIFLYDRDSGQTRRITRSVVGGPANDGSFSPTVSADGQWVAFWSVASNLVDSMPGTCTEEQNIACLYVYLYNQISGTIEQIPIGNAVKDYWMGIDRISLSGDGRFVGFTARDESLDRTEAIVYDRETGEYELMNWTQEGTIGNGDSFSPALSADSRYVAFGSDSSDLVPGDRNSFSDVFVRDRTNGKIELISRAPDGRLGNEDSGRIGRSGRLYSLYFSSEGRYIVYNSLATNLALTAPIQCKPVGLVCNLTYVYDRQTGSTELINDPPTGGWSFFPQISSDGHWVSFMQSRSECTQYQLQCTDVMLYDRQQAWMSNLTKSTEGVLLTPWSYTGGLAIPRHMTKRNAMIFSPDGTWLAMAGDNSPVKVWQISAGIDPYQKRDPDITLEVDDIESYTSLAFSPDGKWLAAGTTTRKSFIWSIPNSRLLYTLEIPSGPVKDLRFSPDGEQLIVSSIMETKIWQIEGKRLIHVSSFSYGVTPIFEVAISPTGNLIATSRGDGTVWLQTVPTGQVISRLGGGQFAISDMVFSMDGSLLATRSMEGKINVWEINRLYVNEFSIRSINTFQTDNLYGPISFSADNRYLASCLLIGGVLLWDVQDGSIFTLQSSYPDGPVDSLAFSSSGDKLAGGLINDDIALWSISPGSASTYFTHALSDYYNNSEPIPISTANDMMLRQPGVEIYYSLEEAAAVANFSILVPAHLPVNVKFWDVGINDDGSLWLEYDAFDQRSGQAKLYIYEQFIGEAEPPTITIGAGATVNEIPIITAADIHIAEYVRGEWIWSREDNPQTNIHNFLWEWSITSPTQRLRWVRDGVFIALYYQVANLIERGSAQLPSDFLLTQQDLVQIAKGMLPFSDLNSLPSPGNYLNSSPFMSLQIFQ